jgi:hypothetical protein
MSVRRADTTGPTRAASSGKSSSLRFVSPTGRTIRGGDGERLSQRVRTSSGSLESLRVSLLMVTQVLRRQEGGRRGRGAGRS